MGSLILMNTNNHFKIKIPSLFRNKNWAVEFGAIYDNLLINYKKQNITQLEIDFSDCIWIDPLPILSLLTFIKQKLGLNKSNIRFKLNNANIPDIEKKTVLRFLNDEGFIALFDDIGTIINTDQNYQDCKSSAKCLPVNE